MYNEAREDIKELTEGCDKLAIESAEAVRKENAYIDQNVSELVSALHKIAEERKGENEAALAQVRSDIEVIMADCMKMNEYFDKDYKTMGEIGITEAIKNYSDGVA